MAGRPRRTETECLERLDRLEDLVSLLVLNVENHVRTRRVTVVDEHGMKRLILSAEQEISSLRVRIASEPGMSTFIELFAIGTGSEPEIGWCAVRGGDVVARWTAG